MAEEELEKVVLPVKSTTFRDKQRDVKRQCVTFFESVQVFCGVTQNDFVVFIPDVS